MQPDAVIVSIRLHSAMLPWMQDSTTDVQLMLGVVGEHAGHRAHFWTTHLILTSGKHTAGAIGAGNAASFIVVNPRRLANQSFALAIEGEATLAGHHVCYRTGEHASLVGEIIDGVSFTLSVWCIGPAGATIGTPAAPCAGTTGADE